MRGKPLIQWTIEAAQKATRLDRVIISTDDEEIAGVARELGVDVPFIRPKNLASDTAATVDVIRHALRECPGYDAVFTLQPTNPLRQPEDIDSAIALLDANENIDAVIGYSLVGERHPARMMFMDAGTTKLAPVLRDFPAYARRQELRPCYLRNGAVYLTRARAIEEGRIEGRSHLPYVIPQSRCWNVDEPDDIKICEVLMEAV